MTRMHTGFTGLVQDDWPRPRGWMPPLLYEAYVSVKRAEAEGTATEDLAQRCARYARIY